MKQIIRLVIISILFLAAACGVFRNNSSFKDDGKIEAIFVQVNDVYEIAPIAGGKEGGMARVATVKKKYKQANTNTFMVMAGDFLSPSVYNSLEYQGKRIRGAQMVEAMNQAGMDLAIFGNHEFDITGNELQDRINESSFSWIASNTFHKIKDSIAPFAKTSGSATTPFPPTYVLNIKDKDGTTAKVGFIGLTLTSNSASFVSYKDPITTARELYNEIKDSVDVVVAITHQALKDDIRLAKELPGLAAILGGHEHSGVFSEIGNVYITKAQSNARSAYIIKLSIDKRNHAVKATPVLETINEKVPSDSVTNEVVLKWKKIAEANYAKSGFDPKNIVIESGEALEGRETEIRNRSTNLTELITQSMAFACPQSDVVIFNSGSIRLDDILSPPVSQYDIVRSLPFGGGITEVNMKGSLLIQVLQAGLNNRNNGGFLQYRPVSYNSVTNLFMINNVPIDSSKIYRVALTDFLLGGKETNLDFLTLQNTAITKLDTTVAPITDTKKDIRLAIIKYLQTHHK